MSIRASHPHIVAAVRLVLAAAVVLIARPVLAQQPQSGPPVIVVSGEGKVRRLADRAIVTMGTQARASKPAEAKRLADDAMRSIITALKNSGVPDTAIRTTSYSIRPDSDEGRVKGYNAENRLEVRVDVAGIGKVLDAAGASGASMTQLEFEVSDRQAAEDEALKLADASGQVAIQIRFIPISSGEIEIVAHVTLVVSVR